MVHNPAGEPSNQTCVHTEWWRKHTASALPSIGSPEWAFTHRAICGLLLLFTLSNVPLKRRGCLPELGRGFQSDIGIVHDSRGQRANLNFWTSQDTLHLQECSVMKQASFNGVEGDIWTWFISVSNGMRKQRQGKNQKPSGKWSLEC